ncbi:sialate O-acetylesterase [Membranihabitans marinus]|uniref:sialate O-acetylesterase n=1 Tax=Membranihabitans marinus TaxID=1227546 RepID=UPI001F275AF3|nr:sialate O-acetylesterase [Membranihabitans marinus]
MKTFFTIVIAFCLAFPVMSQNGLPSATVDSSFHIYLLMGQSNMAGRGKVNEEEKVNPQVLVLNKEKQWVIAKDPLHFDKPNIVGVGPGLSFGKAMVEPGIKIGLIPCAVGGTSIQLWKPGAFDDRTNTHPWDDAIVRIEEGMRYGVVKGVIWHQGESDSSPEKAVNYLVDLNDLIKRIRTLVGNETLPFVAGELGQYKELYQNINRELEKLPASIVHTGLARSQDLTAKEDGVHFNTASAQEFGKRYAAVMKELID